jgi:glutamate synthase (NADPH) small chain
MSGRMLGFVRTDVKHADKRSAPERARDFDEIYTPFATQSAGAQAERCSQCGVPFCQSGCPLANNIPDWLALAAEGRMREAYEASAETNLMPEICGRICPQDRLCEGSCVIEQSGHGHVTIGQVEQWITETAWAEGWVEPISPGPARGQSVGIIGSGPASLAVAEILRRYGYGVTIYERADRAGGLLTYGIPNFKLDKSVIMRRIDRLREGGAIFRLRHPIDTPEDFAQLRAHHDGVFIGIGAAKARPLAIPFDAAATVMPAMDFLTAQNRRGFGDGDVPEPEAAGRAVVVIGGGDTAMDCVRTAIRQGARAVTCLYRRDRQNMPGSAREVGHAEEEGVVFDWLALPKSVRDDGGTGRLQAVRMRLGAPDHSGRQMPEEIAGSDYALDAELIIPALGYEPEPVDQLFGCEELVISSRGTIKTDGHSRMTSVEGVFAGGDIVRGPSLVVWAIKDGMMAGEAMHDWLKARAGASAMAAE